MASVTWQKSALDEVDDIGRRIAHDSFQAAVAFVTDVFPAVDVLELFLRSGRIVPEHKLDDVRELFVQVYRMIYRVTDDEVEVLTVQHGARRLGEIPGL